MESETEKEEVKATQASFPSDGQVTANNFTGQLS